MPFTNMNFWIMLFVYTQIFLLDLYLRNRQCQTLRDSLNCPAAVKKLVSQEQYDRIRSYKLDLNRFALVEKVFQGLGTLLVVCFNPSQWLSEVSLQYSQVLVQEKGIFWQGPYHLAVFFAIYFSVHLLLDAPFAYYKIFRIEQKHKFKKESVTEFVFEELFSLAFCIAAFTVAPVGFAWLMQVTGEENFFSGWLVVCFGIFASSAIYPNISAFLFDKKNPLPEGALRKKVLDLSSKVGFPLREIYVVKANSSMTEHVCTLGWWNFKYLLLSDALVAVDRTTDELDAKTAHSAASSIVPEIQSIEEEWAGISVHTCEDDEASLPSTSQSLYQEQDTQSDEQIEKVSARSSVSSLISVSCGMAQLGLDVEEVVTLVALEIAHWKLGHNIIIFLGRQVKTLFWIVALSSIFYPKECFDGSCRINSFLFAQIFSAALHVVLCQLSRRMVFSADAFSDMWGYGSHLPSAMVKLAKQEGGCALVNHDELFSAVNHCVPTVKERVEGLKKQE